MEKFLEQIGFQHVYEYRQDFVIETGKTLQMVGWTALLAGVLGLLLGILLVLYRPRGLKAHRGLYYILDKGVNIGRSIPFIVLLAVIAPVTRILVGTVIGTKAAIVPLVVGSAPFFARQVEAAMVTVNSGVIEAAEAMGLSHGEILTKVWLPESLPSLIRAFTLTVISIIGLTAMAGLVGGGGLGKLAISDGHNRMRGDIIFVSTALLLLLVFFVQWFGNFLERRSTH